MAKLFNFIKIKKLINEIENITKYISDTSDNTFIIVKSKIINTKIDDLKNKKYKDIDSINILCDRIIDSDIKMMKGVPGESEIIYSKLYELSELIEKLKIIYLEK